MDGKDSVRKYPEQSLVGVREEKGDNTLPAGE